ncbi:MAG: ATP-binding cassette domain-containing protein [Bacteroidia bacterium]|nr:ATP-binding cassette domain-containing protein [Bacteroidia bacterium]
MIRVQNLYKYYEEVCINDNISLEIKEGSIFGLLGPNGAGKTTLMRMLSTVTTPDRGEIYFQDQLLSNKHIPFIGYMPEERGLYRKMSVVDQLLYFAELKGLKRSQAKEQVKYWLKRLEIIDWAEKKMEELSKGMAQKIQFISTILHQPKFLILDEPFSGFDPVNADLVKDLIIELKKQGTTILFSTHRMDNVEELCDRLAIIHKGKKVLDGSIHEVRRSYFNHEYDILFNGNEIPSELPTWATLQKTSNSEFGYLKARIHLTEPSKTQDLISWAHETHQMIGFQENVPTMHQIFVDKVTQA